MDIYLNFQLVYEKFEVRLNFNQTVDSITWIKTYFS
jgi:hypothetical protein